MNIDIVGILVPISLFAMIGLIVYFVSKFSYQTKKAILDKGGNAEDFKKKYRLLDFGLLIVGFGIGLSLAVIPQTSNLAEEAKDLLVGACIFIFGGLGLLTAFFIRRKIDKK